MSGVDSLPPAPAVLLAEVEEESVVVAAVVILPEKAICRRDRGALGAAAPAEAEAGGAAWSWLLTPFAVSRASLCGPSCASRSNPDARDAPPASAASTPRISRAACLAARIASCPWLLAPLSLLPLSRSLSALGGGMHSEAIAAIRLPSRRAPYSAFRFVSVRRAGHWVSGKARASEGQ